MREGNAGSQTLFDTSNAEMGFDGDTRNSTFQATRPVMANRPRARRPRPVMPCKVRMEKVLAIRAALASGTYNIPAAAVALKLMDGLLNAGSE